MTRKSDTIFIEYAISSYSTIREASPTAKMNGTTARHSPSIVMSGHMILAFQFIIVMLVNVVCNLLNTDTDTDSLLRWGTPT